MTAAALTPRVRIMAMCDGIRKRHAESDVFDLRGVRRSLTVPTVPFKPARLWLFLWLSSARVGEFPCYIRVLNDQSDRAVYYKHLHPRPIFVAEGGWWGTRTPIQCTFPNLGQYTVQVWFFQAHGQDVLKGEMPFSIAEGES